ncbi:hypothetical protein [Terricaulis sp.]|uniref:hypothetical protein n=1 Tax=Terricaulis sp. TaxID=2768686 RepID=UPI003783183E
MWRRWLAGVLGAFNALNGVVMLADGRRWYDSVPGVVLTGPYNPHFVQDIGAAFLAAGLGLLARAWRPRYWPAAVAGAAFIGAHAIIHVAMLFGMMLGLCSDEAWASDIALVIVPAGLALLAAFPDKGEQRA